MFEIFKTNPYILVTVLAVGDIFGLLGFIIYTVKNSSKEKRAKKIITAAVCFVVIDAVFSFFIISSNTIYDKNANRYFDQNELTYYDTDENAYKLMTDDKLRTYLVSEDGKSMYSAERIYIDKENGCIFYDRTNELTQKTQYIYTDGDGKEYYRLKDVQWDKNGHIKLISEK